MDGALAVSLLSAAVGGVPLWLLMLRRARRGHQTKQTACLLLPVIAPCAYLAALAITTRLVGTAAGVSTWWFGVLVALGFATAGIACAGPILAMGRLRPRGPAVQLAAHAAGLAAAAIALAGLASGIAAIGLTLWARDFAAYHQAGQLGGYLAVVTAAALTAIVSAARGVRAMARPER